MLQRFELVTRIIFVQGSTHKNIIFTLFSVVHGQFSLFKGINLLRLESYSGSWSSLIVAITLSLLY